MRAPGRMPADARPAAARQAEAAPPVLAWMRSGSLAGPGRRSRPWRAQVATTRRTGLPGRTDAGSPAARAAPLRKAAPNGQHPHRAAGQAPGRLRARTLSQWRPGCPSKGPGAQVDAPLPRRAAAAGQDGPRHGRRARQADRCHGSARKARRAASRPSAPHAVPARGAAAGQRAPTPGFWTGPAERARQAARTRRPWDAVRPTRCPPGVGGAGAVPAAAGHGVRPERSPGAAQPAAAARPHQVSEAPGGRQPPAPAAAAVSTGHHAAMSCGPVPCPSLSAESRPWGGRGISAVPRVLVRAEARASARSAAPPRPSPAAAAAPADPARKRGTPHGRPAKCRRRRPATSRPEGTCSAASRHPWKPHPSPSAQGRAILMKIMRTHC
jgi:hypothetical protein